MCNLRVGKQTINRAINRQKVLLWNLKNSEIVDKAASLRKHYEVNNSSAEELFTSIHLH